MGKKRRKRRSLSVRSEELQSLSLGRERGSSQQAWLSRNIQRDEYNVECQKPKEKCLRTEDN